MLDGKSYQAHFPDDPAYAAPRIISRAALLEALAALETEFRAILRQTAAPPE